MSDRAAFEAAVAAAIGEGEARDHAASAASWERAAGVAMRAGARASVFACLDAAGEAWRRADQPRRALDCLRGALQHTDDVAWSTRVKLASVLADRGAGREAIPMLEAAVDQAASSTMALDTLIGVLQGFGTIAALRPRVAALGVALGVDHPAARFRRGQLRRLDGALDLADDDFAEVQRQMSGVAGAEAGAAAASMERAEIAVYRGDPGAALSAFEEGRRLHEAAGRVALAWACEAGRLRASAVAGLPTISPGLDVAIDRSLSQGMDLLALDLTLARGMVWAAQGDPRAAAALEQVVGQASAWGCWLRAGHARWAQLNWLSGGPDRERWRDQALAWLAEHVPLRSRVPPR